MTLDQKNGFDEFFIHETEVLPTRRDNQTGSRFAKFFAKREGEEEEVVQKEPTIEPRSISVNDLFGNNGITHQHQQHLQQQQKQQPIENNNNVRVLSEDDILQSLGAKKNSSNDKPVMNDAIGFNRVLQILSQPKVNIHTSTAIDCLHVYYSLPLKKRIGSSHLCLRHLLMNCLFH